MYYSKDFNPNDPELKHVTPIKQIMPSRKREFLVYLGEEGEGNETFFLQEIYAWALVDSYDGEYVWSSVLPLVINDEMLPELELIDEQMNIVGYLALEESETKPSDSDLKARFSTKIKEYHEREAKRKEDFKKKQEANKLKL